jgi:hypothetical protein
MKRAAAAAQKEQDMATDRTQMQRTSPRRRGKTGIVRGGTKGMKDASEDVRSQVARAMVASRDTVEIACALEGCDRGEDGQPKVFTTRLVDGEPEAKACCSAHRLRLWRQEMRAKGYKYRTINGVLGWVTPDGIFYPTPSQPRRRRTDTRERHVSRWRRLGRESPESG